VPRKEGLFRLDGRVDSGALIQLRSESSRVSISHLQNCRAGNFSTMVTRPTLTLSTSGIILSQILSNLSASWTPWPSFRPPRLASRAEPTRAGSNPSLRTFILPQLSHPEGTITASPSRTLARCGNGKRAEACEVGIGIDWAAELSEVSGGGMLYRRWRR
jgi:hypothetical protein